MWGLHFFRRIHRENGRTSKLSRGVVCSASRSCSAAFSARDSFSLRVAISACCNGWSCDDKANSKVAARIAPPATRLRTLEKISSLNNAWEHKLFDRRLGLHLRCRILLLSHAGAAVLAGAPGWVRFHRSQTLRREMKRLACYRGACSCELHERRSAFAPRARRRSEYAGRIL
jgi:hypothetical protein